MLSLPQQAENSGFSSDAPVRVKAHAAAGLSAARGRRILLLALFVSALASVGGASGAAGAELCLAPAAPAIDLPAEVLADYRAEISGEFEAYFAAITSYVACLDNERVRAMVEAQAAAAAYSHFLNLPHIQEDIR